MNLFLVPAMTPRTQDFQGRARDLGTDCRATTLVVNSRWLLNKLNIRFETCGSVVYFPMKNKQDFERLSLTPCLEVVQLNEHLADDIHKE